MDTEIMNELLRAMAKVTIAEPENHKESFNIFNVLGVETKEVIICRFIGELLNPDGCHQMKDLPLRLFAQTVLRLPEFDANISKLATVELEASIDEQRRVDIAIHAGKKVIPIEVKIWAGDQDSQLSDYYQFYKKKNLLFSDKIYYLTPSGWPPTKISCGALQVDKQIIRLSFSKHIREWMEHLYRVSDKTTSVHIILKQFIEVIDTMCEKTTDLNAIKDVLGLNYEFAYTENLKAAIKLLAYKEEIEKAIMISYLSERLKINKQRFDLLECEETDRKAINDKHALLKLVSKATGEDVAWFCVHTNLYLVAKKVKNPNNGIWDSRSAPEKDYYWQYISPYGVGKEFPLKKLTDFPEQEIAFDECLDDIVLERN